MTSLEPGGICIHCSAARPPRDPAAPCPGCGQVATDVTWTRTDRGWGHLVTTAVLGLCAVISAVAVTVTRGIYTVAALAVAVGTAALAVVSWRRPPFGTWTFARADGSIAGSATWHERKLFLASARAADGLPIALVADPALADRVPAFADDEALLAALRAPLGLDDERRLRAGMPFHLSAAAASLLARGGLRGVWLASWGLSPWQAAEGRDPRTQTLGLAVVDATLAESPAERWIVTSIAALATPSEPATGGAHYRAAERATGGVVVWDTLLDRWDAHGFSMGEPPGPPPGILVAVARVDRPLVLALLELSASP